MKRPRYANGVESNNKKCSSSEALPCEVYEFDSLKKKSTGLKVVAEDLLGIKLQSLRARSKSHLSSEVFAGYKRKRGNETLLWGRKQNCPSWHGEWGGDFGISAKLHCFRTLILLLTAVLIMHTCLTYVNLN